MYKVSGSVLASDMAWIPDADVFEVGSDSKTKTDYGGEFSLNVKSSDSQISIGKMGYITQIMTAKDLNDFGIVYLDYGITVRTKPKNNNVLLAIVAAVFITTAVVVYSKNRAKPIKIK